MLNEIMPMIYKRFTDKAAEEWRQIYKVPPNFVTLVIFKDDAKTGPFV